MGPVEIFSIIKDIALAAAACVTGYVAIVGLGAWQREIRGRANFDVARQLAKSVYVLRDQVSYCRSPFTAAQEFPSGYQGGLSNPTGKEEGDAWAHVYANRWMSVGKAVQDFDAASLEAEALWGHDVKVQWAELRGCVRELQVDIEMFIRDKYSDGHLFKNTELAKTIESGVWDMKSDDNELTKRINKAIAGIEAFLRPHLSRS
jgi:hypothetical protein